MRPTILTLAFVVLSTCVFAQDALPREMEQAKPITIHMTNAPLSDVFKLLGTVSGVDIRIQGGDRPVTVNFRNARVVDVFNFFINAGRLTYSVPDEKTVIVTVAAAAR